jgi:hypothetical protein
VSTPKVVGDGYGISVAMGMGGVLVVSALNNPTSSFAPEVGDVILAVDGTPVRCSLSLTHTHTLPHCPVLSRALSLSLSHTHTLSPTASFSRVLSPHIAVPPSYPALATTTLGNGWKLVMGFLQWTAHR